MKLFDRIALSSQMDVELHFKEQFVTTFLATWVANNYAEACLRDKHETLYNPPVEDAEHLAGKAWEKVKEKSDG